MRGFSTDESYSPRVDPWETTEGLELDAYVAIPVGATNENPPPLLVIAHGGPWAQTGKRVRLD